MEQDCFLRAVIMDLIACSSNQDEKGLSGIDHLPAQALLRVEI